jgi:cell division septation protein DedD
MPTQSDLKKLGKFTVQLVTYNDKTQAENEISRLKSKGYEGFIIPSGHYYQVCASYFDTKSNARSQLEELKQTGRYPDAYIRPVIR